jgi:hypothetical protein
MLKRRSPTIITIAASPLVSLKLIAVAIHRVRDLVLHRRVLTDDPKRSTVAAVSVGMYAFCLLLMIFAKRDPRPRRGYLTTMARRTSLGAP